MIFSDFCLISTVANSVFFFVKCTCPKGRYYLHLCGPPESLSVAATGTPPPLSLGCCAQGDAIQVWFIRMRVCQHAPATDRSLRRDSIALCRSADLSIRNERTGYSRAAGAKKILSIVQLYNGETHAVGRPSAFRSVRSARLWCATCSCPQAPTQGVHRLALCRRALR